MSQTQLISFISATTQRVDSYLAEFLDLSRNQIQKWIVKQKVRVNGDIVNKRFRLSYGDKIELEQIEFEKPNLIISDADIKIVYEDKDIILVDKPSGLVVHPGAAKEAQTVVGALLYKGIALSDLGSPLRPGVVHRIDKDTSGIIVLAKNNRAHLKLAQQFSEHTVKRYYIGVVEGHLDNSSGCIETEIGRHPKNRKIFTVTSGKKAMTLYKVIMTLKNIDIVRFELKTGRTHQIRVHMRYLNHPLVGDSVYSKTKQKLISRQALHAFYLGFYHPINNEFLRFYSRLPKDILNLIFNRNFI